MPKEKRSRVRRRRGCVGGCLARLIMLAGFLALLFVGAHYLGFITNDAETGQPRLTFGDEAVLQLPGSAGNGISALLSAIPAWPYAVKSEGLTLKVLRGGAGQALLLCCDGYTAILGGGSGTYAAGLQTLLCGVTRLDAAIAPSSDARDTGGLAFAIKSGNCSYLFYTDSQTRTREWQRMTEASGNCKRVVPEPGLSFNLGRGRVTFLGPQYQGHAKEEDDSFSLRIDYGTRSIFVPGRFSQEGESELLAGGNGLKADVLIIADGGEDGTIGERLIAAVSPSAAVCTGDADWRVKARLQSAGAKVYTIREHGVMTVRSDGTSLQIDP